MKAKITSTSTDNNGVMTVRIAKNGRPVSEASARSVLGAAFPNAPSDKWIFMPRRGHRTVVKINRELIAEQHTTVLITEVAEADDARSAQGADTSKPSGGSTDARGVAGSAGT